MDKSYDYTEDLKQAHEELIATQLKVIDIELSEIKRDIKAFENHFPDAVDVDAKDNIYPWSFHPKALTMLAKRYGVKYILCYGSAAKGFAITFGPKIDDVVKVKPGTKKPVNHPAKIRRVCV